MANLSRFLRYNLIVKGEIRNNLVHLSGKKEIAIEKDEVIACVIVKNGENHMNAFVEYHLQKGIKHIILVDNGSTDSTIELAQRFDEVSVYTTDLSYRKYEHFLRRYMEDVYGKESWFITLDIDERFDYPNSSEVSLKQFINYLDQNKQTAVVSYMLDLFSIEEISKWPYDGFDIEEKCIWYKNDDVEVFDHPLYRNISISDNNIKRYMGGIRKTVFNVLPDITKVPLKNTRLGAKVKINSAHYAEGCKIADVSGLLLHYKFDSVFRERHSDVLLDVEKYNYSNEYLAYVNAVDGTEDFKMNVDSPKQFQDTDQLLEEKFLYASHAYQTYCENIVQRKSELANI
ncbi:MAG: glycosyltransferase family 2 protein [Bacteroidota bacterium]